VLVTQPVPAAQEERKEEHATEEAQQFSAYHPDGRLPVSPVLALAIAVILAGAGVSLWRGRPRRREAPALALARGADRFPRPGRRRWPR
jgi:hypothetical protein